MIVIDAAMEANDDAALKKLLPLLSAAAKETATEKGCVKYQFSIDIDNPRLIRINELWESEADLFAHFQLVATKPLIGQIGAMSRMAHMKALKGDLTPLDLPIPS
ncbi:MAG: antibiotic biosynthesis monooxygenase family protein [Caulobacterales bacterium]